MVQTFYFLFKVWRDTKLKNELLQNLNDVQKEKIIIDNCVLTFLAEEEKVTVTANAFSPKIIPAKISFETLRAMISEEDKIWDVEWM